MSASITAVSTQGAGSSSSYLLELSGERPATAETFEHGVATRNAPSPLRRVEAGKSVSVAKLLATLLALTALAALAAVVIAANGDEEPWPQTPRGDLLPPVLNGPTIVWAVGDGADGSARAQRVAARIGAGAGHPLRMLYLGDVYETGTAAEYQANYESVYGRLKERTAPTIGNHELDNRDEGYIPYWSEVHGRAPSYYNLRASGWQILGLNSEIDAGPDSEQVAWVKRQLAKRKFGNCRIAFWHRPRYSAGAHGDQPDLSALWDAVARRTRVVLSGHDHDMQRHRPRDGVVAFISGAGGHVPRPTDAGDPRLAFSEDDRPGALRLRLGHENLRWWFISAGGKTLDRGELLCRRGPPKT